MKKIRTFDSPVGRLRLEAADDALTGLYFAEGEEQRADESEILDRAQRQLEEYFAGTRREFDLPLRPEGTPFQLADWKALEGIPYGETVSYGDIARAIGKPKACRAVGMANHANPISIIVPCHRVVGSNGKLTGYGGGLAAKQWLLEHEQKWK